MAAPTLGLLGHTSISTAESTTGWTKFDTLDADIKKEGSNSITGTLRNDTEEGYYDAGSAPVTAAGKHVRYWINTTNLPYMDTEANGGYELLMYDGSTTEYKTIFGSDTYFGGWFNMVFDCDLFTSLTLANVQRWGVRIQHTASAKNVDNTWMDYIRYLDGYYATGGTSGDKITLETIAVADRGTTTLYGYGIILENEGVYFSYGQLQIGNGATTTFFEMDGDVLVFTDQPVAAGLYDFSAAGSGCNCVITDSVINAAGITASTRFVMDFSDTNATVSITTSVFQRAGACTFASGQTITGNTFNDCGQITHGGADMDNCSIKNYEGTANTSALIYNVNADPDGEMDNMSFEKGTALTHAIEFGTTSPLTMTLRGVTFTGYNASNNQNDSTLHIKRTTGTVTINLIGVTGNVSYRTDGATVIVQQTVTLTVTCKNSAGNAVEGVRVRIEKTDGTLISNGSTNASGVYSDSSYNYTVDTEVNVIARLKAYKFNEAKATITSSGLTVPFTMIRDAAVNLP